MLQGSFTTGSSSDNQAPSVELKDPTHSPITLQFSKTMDPATLTPDNFQVTDAASKALISGAVHVSEDLRTASFIPSVPLPPDHSFEIVIKTGVKDTSGNGLANQMRFHFTTNR
jgi:hypothetical protein